MKKLTSTITMARVSSWEEDSVGWILGCAVVEYGEVVAGDCGCERGEGDGEISRDYMMVQRSRGGGAC
ncbi:hypothetical protein L2E82_39185 [Cichorium intybus]|uniref:Uncharacterized protein n=1 Tax=Cichorium intybus TaxID=13427 RepID=A0ACB9AHV7_CICIN|nr:hypothetical protein L2E82_39185 [Cichorium intybus]